MSFFAKLAVLISANTAEFKAGLDDANKSAKKFEAEQKKAMREAAKAAKELEGALKTTAQVAAAAALAIGGALRWADEIADTADAFDVTVSSLLSMRDALAMAGGKVDNFGTMLQKLSNEAQAAREGTDKARASFEKLGITGKEVEESAPDELFARVAEALSKIEDPIARNAAAFDLLGKAAKGVDWKEYWKNYSSGKATTEGVSQAIEEGAKAWDNLGAAGRAALEGILVLVKPFTAFINFMADKLREGKQKPLPGSLFDLEMGGTGNLENAGPGTPPAAAQAAASKKEGGYKKPPSSEAGFPAATQAVREQTDELVRQVSVMIKREEMQSKFIAMTKNQRELAEAVFKIEEDRDKLIANAEKEIAIEQKREKINTEKVKALQDQIETIKYAKEVEIEAISSIIQKRQEEQQTFEYGWNKAFRQYAEDAQNYSRIGEQAFNSVISNMDMALTEFTTKGSFNFKKLTGSILQDLIRIQLRMQMMQLFGMAFNKGRLLLGSFGFGTGIGYGSQDYGLAFADGGQPPVNQPVLVGEQGPELFVPRSPGTVIPNQQLSSYMGNQPQIVYNGPYIQNMSAIDTQSATQFLAANKQAVWAANQSASRGIPTSR